MRILHAFKNYYPPTRGGVEQHLNEVVHSIPGHQMTVLTSSGGRKSVRDRDEGVDVIRTAEYGRPVSTPITPAWTGVLRRTEADLLHFHMPNPFGELAYIASGTETPMVASYHADIVGRRLLVPFFTPFQQRFLQRARHILVGSPRLVDTSPALARHRQNTVVVPYGVDPGYWKQRPAQADELRARHTLPLVVCMGRFSYYKGAHVLIQAMSSVEATCLLVGGGPKLEELKALARDLGLHERVVFAGEIEDDERRTYLHAADVFVLPSTSRAESFGIALLQAMACGTPVVSTEIGTGTSWVNQHGSTGLVVPPGDPAALAQALGRLLGENAMRMEMGAAAAERVAASFTRRAMLSCLEAIYSSCN